jgi:hypothetical protein
MGEFWRIVGLRFPVPSRIFKRFDTAEIARRKLGPRKVLSGKTAVYCYDKRKQAEEAKFDHKVGDGGRWI